MMDIHNVMEEIVFTRINDLYEQVKKVNPSWLTCDCINCRLDTASYVLNRIPPRYIVSGRGVTHTADTLDDAQLKADIDALGLEGIRLVSSAKRPYHTTNRKNCQVPSPNGPVFNFPTFLGSVMDGSTFEPLAGATILLRQNEATASMADMTWANPSYTFKSTRGDYTFWVKPVPAEKDNMSGKFHFTIEITAPGYTDVMYAFDVPLVSESVDRSQLDSTYSLKIKDLFLFRSDIENPME
jgi:competence protein ComFB